jgi:3-oxoacyl-[acyl-carrier protein] reductase
MSGVQERVALVTGGGAGIGAGIARRFAAEGARVGVLDRSAAAAEAVAQEITDAGGVALPLVADVTDRGQVTAAVNALVDSQGGLHVLVNNAGVLRDNLLFKMSDDDWRTVLDVHLGGAFVCTQVAQKHMVEAGHGRVVCMSSIGARGNRGQANYSAAKAGLQGFTKTLALELGPRGITANAICPGFVDTAMIAETAARTGTTVEEMREAVSSRLPVRRYGVPDDVAHAALFFASDEAGYVTGQVLTVDGGRTLL